MTTFYSDVEPFSKYSPVMLHLSPATRILNENPAMSHEQLQPLFKVMVLMRPCQGKIPTSNMGLKRWHKTDEMATIDMKMGWESDSNKNNAIA